MCKQFFSLCTVLLTLAACGCSVADRNTPTLAEGPVQWGETAGGLQMGIAAETWAAPPNQPQPVNPPLQSVKIYLRNDGSNALMVLNPAAAPQLRTADPTQALVTILSGRADSGPQPTVYIPPPNPPRFVELTPTQMTWFSVPVTSPPAQAASAATTAPSNSALWKLAAQYQNSQSVIAVTPNGASGPATTVSGVWTGQITSGILQQNINP
jgi:hypothetical protein